MTTGGGGDFQYGSDRVTAELRVSIPDTDIQNLHRVTLEVQKLRTELEAVSRANGDYVGQMEAMPEIQMRVTQAQKDYLTQLERMIDYQNQAVTGQSRAYMTGARQVGPWDAQHGYNDPFAGMTHGMGYGYAQGIPGFPMTQAGMMGYMSEMRTDDPRLWSNMAAQRYPPSRDQLELSHRGIHVPAQQPDQRDMDQLADRIGQRVGQELRSETTHVLDETTHTLHHPQQHPTPQHPTRHPTHPGAMPAPGQPFADSAEGAVGFVQQLMHEMRPGGTMGNFGTIVQTLLSGTSHLGTALGAGKTAAAAGTAMDAAGASAATAGAEGLLSKLGLGGSSGALASAGGIAAVVGAAVAAYAAIQEGGEIYQSYKNMGLVRGGGAAQGLGYEMRIREMALNPFITTEQSRQIITTALREGYSGKEFDTVTQFMASNLQDMNIQVADSVSLLHSNVNVAGQSLGGLKATLAGLTEAAKTGYIGQPELVQRAAQAGETLSAQGQRAQDIGINEQAYAEMFKDVPNSLSRNDVSNRFLQAAANTPSYLSQVGYLSGDPSLQGQLPDVIGQAASPEQMWAPIMQYARMYAGSGPNGISLFRLRVNALLPGLNITYAEASDLMDYLNKNGNPGAAATKAARQADVAVNRRDPILSTLGLVAKEAWQAGTAPTRTNFNLIQDVFQPSHWGEIPGDLVAPFKRAWQQGQELPAEAQIASSFNQNNVIDQLVRQWGAGGLEVLDENGRSLGPINMNDPIAMNNLQSGKYRLHHKGTTEPGFKLSEATGAAGGAATNPSVGFRNTPQEVTGELTITVHQDGSVTAPPSVRLSPTKRQANQGYGSGTINDPVPGYNWPTPLK